MSGAQVKGDKNASAVLLEFTDFQCPFCGQFERQALPSIQSKYVDSGKLQLALRHYPLTGHELAPKAAEAAICSGRQGKFWPMHDLLFGNQQLLDQASFELRAQQLHLQMTAFENCLNGQATDELASDIALAHQLEVNGTPTFFVGRLQKDGSLNVSARFAGLQSMPQLSAAIDALIAGR